MIQIGSFVERREIELSNGDVVTVFKSFSEKDYSTMLSWHYQDDIHAGVDNTLLTPHRCKDDETGSAKFEAFIHLQLRAQIRIGHSSSGRIGTHPHSPHTPSPERGPKTSCRKVGVTGNGNDIVAIPVEGLPTIKSNSRTSAARSYYLTLTRPKAIMSWVAMSVKRMCQRPSLLSVDHDFHYGEDCRWRMEVDGSSLVLGMEDR
ncbi:hypothetical protein EDC04DRAFT_3091841 [Pisolithus marmoratus]|nr:hypothetical protein EDC04DRAFT_3091841 [Pisolithus marmoratus]